MNPFDYLRQFKEVTDETERLVRKRTYGMTDAQLLDIFEKGITGDFGKVYKLDPQTLIGWLNARKRPENASGGYLGENLADPAQKYHDFNSSDWMKEANKCYAKFLSGVDISAFHPLVYDTLMLSGKIDLNTCMKYLTDNYGEREVTAAKQKVLRDVFITYKSKGWNQIYNV